MPGAGLPSGTSAPQLMALMKGSMPSISRYRPRLLPLQSVASANAVSTLLKLRSYPAHGKGPYLHKVVTLEIRAALLQDFFPRFFGHLRLQGFKHIRAIHARQRLKRLAGHGMVGIRQRFLPAAKA